MRIAIAGGTSPTLGASILNALQSDGHHKPIILSRQPTNQHPNLETRVVDYTSIPSLTTALKGIHTLISVLLVPGPEMVPYQLNLLAAAEVAGVKRFLPSEFALPAGTQQGIDFDKMKLAVWEGVYTSVQEGRIDAARVPCGMWMNYLAIGCREDRREEGLAGFREAGFIVHLDEQEPWVEIPLLADGRYPSLTMTDLRDIGRFVKAAVEMEEPWGGRELGMVGDVVSFEELVRLCERYTGKRVQRREVTETELRKRLEETPAEEVLKRMETQILLAGCRDGYRVAPTLNGLCDVQPRTIEQFLARYWGQ